MSNLVTLVLPSKGAIAEPTINFLRDCGLRVEKPNQRQYTGTISAIPEITVLFQRVNDVLYKVADGTAQIGITGFDIVCENIQDNLIIIHEKLGYGHCDLVVAIPEMWVDVTSISDLVEVALDFRDHKHRNLRIATKYPTLSRQFLHQQGIHHFTLVKAEGAIEAAPTLGYADVIIDLTQTGTTLRENNLKMLADGTILKSQACLIGNRAILRDDSNLRHTLRTFLEYIDAAQHGRGFYQLIANIQGQSAEEVAQKVASNRITRGLQGPTIAPIYTSGDDKKSTDKWYTLTIIIESHDLLPAMEHIRTIGGTQTIASPVRYIFLEQSPTFQRLLAALQV
jgi:ATP phosphoribosyltransferase